MMGHVIQPHGQATQREQLARRAHDQVMVALGVPSGRPPDASVRALARCRVHLLTVPRFARPEATLRRAQGGAGYLVFVLSVTVAPEMVDFIPFCGQPPLDDRVKERLRMRAAV